MYQPRQDLVRNLDIDHVWEFMSFSSYGTGTTSSGAVQMVLDLKMDIGGRDVLVVEDICQ
jgi:hypoxanthine phosphoribosyltransferase